MICERNQRENVESKGLLRERMHKFKGMSKTRV